MKVTFVTGTFDIDVKFESPNFLVVPNEKLGKCGRKYSIFFKGNTSAPMVIFVKTIKDAKEAISYFESHLMFDYSLDNLKKVYDQYYDIIR